MKSVEERTFGTPCSVCTDLVVSGFFFRFCYSYTSCNDNTIFLGGGGKLPPLKYTK